MCRFIESIQLNNGEFRRLNFHQARVQQVFDDHYPNSKVLQLTEILQPLDIPKKGIFKCRIVFNNELHQLEITPYIRREINSLKLVATDMKSLPYKIEDRTKINEAYAKRGNCDDVLLAKHGLLTDTSYSNIALYNGIEWFTPTKPLIYGVNRAQLIDENKIIEKDIKPSDIKNFRSIRLFNAMIEFGEIELTIDRIML